MRLLYCNCCGAQCVNKGFECASYADICAARLPERVRWRRKFLGQYVI